MLLLYHAYVYLEFLILACTIYILAPEYQIVVEYAETHNLSISQLIRMGVELQMKQQANQ